ncbi:hypothetical protein B0H13DRAFT_2351439 [Mycena leptocephala]|nr:hypothetical protein B0H13DRAFT_2351439 [Mycena leptocephala]
MAGAAANPAGTLFFLINAPEITNKIADKTANHILLQTDGEVCQCAAKLAICKGMDTDIRRTQERREKDEDNTMMVIDTAEDKEDPVPEITRFVFFLFWSADYFEGAMKFARCLV